MYTGGVADKLSRAAKKRFILVELSSKDGSISEEDLEKSIWREI